MSYIFGIFYIFTIQFLHLKAIRKKIILFQQTIIILFSHDSSDFGVRLNMKSSYDKLCQLGKLKKVICLEYNMESNPTCYEALKHGLICFIYLKY